MKLPWTKSIKKTKRNVGLSSKIITSPPIINDMSYSGQLANQYNQQESSLRQAYGTAFAQSQLSAILHSGGMPVLKIKPKSAVEKFIEVWQR